MNHKKPSQIKRLSERALSRLVLDLKDELVAVQAQLSLAKREQRGRRKGKAQAKRAQRSCGRPADVLGLERRSDGETVH